MVLQYALSAFVIAVSLGFAIYFYKATEVWNKVTAFIEIFVIWAVLVSSIAALIWSV